MDYILTTHDNVNSCISCKVELTSDLMARYDCKGLLSDRCKAPDHSILTVHMSYSDMERHRSTEPNNININHTQTNLNKHIGPISQVGLNWVLV